MMQKRYNIFYSHLSGRHEQNPHQFSYHLFLNCDSLNHFQSHSSGLRPDQQGYWCCQVVGQAAALPKFGKHCSWGQGDVLIHNYESFFFLPHAVIPGPRYLLHGHVFFTTFFEWQNTGLLSFV